MMRSSIYGMQRANGDWFAIKEPVSFRVPLFSSEREAMQARAFNVEMLVFRPVVIDERALKDLQTEAGYSFYFWLVEEGSRNMKRGAVLQPAELTLIPRGT